jgi:hypothetical protein
MIDLAMSHRLHWTRRLAFVTGLVNQELCGCVISDGHHERPRGHNHG